MTVPGAVARDRVVLVLGAMSALALGACSSSTAPGIGRGALWVGNAGTNTILGYSAGQLDSSSGGAPAVTITTPGDNMSGEGTFAAAVDHSGNLWVAEVNQTVVEYTSGQLGASGNPSPAVTLTTNHGTLSLPSALAFDAGGNLWVANNGGGIGGGGKTVVEFTRNQLAVSGNPIPAVTLGNNGISIENPSGLAFDRSGNLWITNEGSIDEFSVPQLATSGNPLPAVELLYGVGNSKTASGLAFDHEGNLWVTAAAAGNVDEFTSAQLLTSGSPTPAVTLRSSGALVVPLGPAFDSHGNLWVASVSSPTTGTVLQYAANQLGASGAPTPAVIISGAALSLPFALAFSR